MVVYRKETNNLDPITGNTAAPSIEETSDEGEKTANAASLMVPRAILTSRPNSHPFLERHLVLDQPVKVGRSVVRCRCSTNNAIFDCKVLSRNHALLWYENGKFYLQDTKSSNGTFVNNQRLSKGSEESPAREVCSGDIVQFGVDVVENSRKVVHGCVVATLRLFLPDGKEAKASPTTVVLPCPEASISSQELYQLYQFLQEAIHKEKALERKLQMLQQRIANIQDESDTGWKALIEEDRLLSRIETLESQLQTCGKNVTEEKLKDDVLKLQDDKDKYQIAAKESLKKVLQEKLEAIHKVQDLETSLSNAENECSYLRELRKTTEQEMQDLLEKNGDMEKEIVETNKKLQEMEEKYQDTVNQTADEKIDYENKIEDMRKSELSLSAKIEALEAENDFSKEQIESLKGRFESYKERQQSEEKIEKNGLSPVEDELDISGEETTEKKVLIQEFISEVNNRELHATVEEENENEVPLTIKFSKKEDHHMNGDIKSSDYINKLQAEIQQLKKLLTETRESKKSVDAELVLLKAHSEKTQISLKKLQDEFRSLEQDLSLAKEDLRSKTEELNKLEELNLVQNSEDKDMLSEKEQAQLKGATDSEEIKSLRDLYQKTQSDLKASQNESESLKIKVKELMEELDQQKADKKKVILESEGVCKECAQNHARIQALESETRKYRNLNTRLEADNKSLQETCTKLEKAKVALENKSDDYWKAQCKTAESKKDALSNQLSEALNEILMIKERFDECNDEKTMYKKEKDVLSKQLQILSIRSQASYALCIIPIIVLVVAAIMAFYPSLSHLTATSDQT